MSTLSTSFRILLAAAALAFSGVARADLFKDHASDLQQESLLAGKAGKRLVVLFEQEDCEACETLRHKVLSSKAAERQFGRAYRTLSVDIGHRAELITPDGKPGAARAWAARLRIPGTPAIAFFDRDGKLLYRHVGPLADSGELLLLGRYIAAGEYERRPFVSYLSARKLGVRPGSAASGAICHTRNS